MAKTDPNTHFVCSSEFSHHPTPATFPNTPSESPTAQIGKCRELSFSTQSGNRPEITTFTSRRCSEKGCVFPASSLRSGKCAYHERQMEEPVHFCSEQPSHLLLDPSRLMPADEEYDLSRKRDRRRLAKQWEEFQRESEI